MTNKILNAKQLCAVLGISTTLFYKLKRAGMPYHQLPESRAYYMLDEVETWLSKAGYQQKAVKIWTK